MFDAIRAAMRTPLARPPGRRPWWSRFAPELCALAVYGAGAAVTLCRSYRDGVFDLDPEHFMQGAVAAYWLGTVILWVFPLVHSLSAWHGECSRGTADALVLTASDHEAIAGGRYWRVAWPWLRFMLLLTPLYGVMALHGFVGEVCGWQENSLLIGGVGVGGSRGFFSFLLFDIEEEARGFSVAGFALLAGRWLCDAKSLLALVAFGCLMSARIKSNVGLFAGYALLPLTTATVFSLHDWSLWLMRFPPNRYADLKTAGVVYALIAALTAAAEVCLALWAYRRLARNFDAYMTGEKPSALRPEGGGV